MALFPLALPLAPSEQRSNSGAGKLAQRGRRDETDQQAEDRDDDENFQQGEALLARRPPAGDPAHRIKKRSVLRHAGPNHMKVPSLYTP
jgi:hypothetical protein